MRISKIISNLIILVAFFCALTIKAQQPSVEKSISGVQLGFMSAWVYHEIRLFDNITLRAEGGLGAGFWYQKSFFDTNANSGFVVRPIFAVEPRYYYNLNNRYQKQKKIDNNAANFVSLNVEVDPGWIIASNEKDLSASSNISLIPTWGIRRNLGKHFNYELGVGVGYQYVFNIGGDLVFRPHLRIGYQF